RDGAEHAGPGTDMPAYHDVLDGAQGTEQPYVLKGASQAGNGDLVRFQARELVPHEIAGTRFRHIQAGQHVEQSGLAGAIGPDQAVDVALANRETDIGQGLQAAKALAQLARHQQQFGHGAGVGIDCGGNHAWPSLLVDSSRRRTAEGHRPAGRKIMTSTRAKPKSSMRIPSGSRMTSPNMV